MCVAPDSLYFWIGLAIFVALTAIAARSLWRFWREAQHARTAQEWGEALMDGAPALVVNGLWLFIAILAAGACGFGLGF